jgi:release factor glutamine methyltransferase
MDYLHCSTESILEQQYMQYQQLLSRRIEHEPLQYITGEQEFMGLTFDVDNNVLIPRQDTEILVELVMSQCKTKKVLDVCTGSGCIAISLAKLGEPKSISALDISSGALKVAKKNAVRNEVEIEFIESNMFEKVTEVFDIIVSNPPYIKQKEIDTLMPEVKQYEPALALDGNVDGLEFYRILTSEAKKYLTPEGKVFFEIGFDQAEDVARLLSENGYYNIKVTKDYAKLDRVVSASIDSNGNR